MAAFKIIFLYFICFLKSTCSTLCISDHMASSYQDKSPTHTLNLLSSSAEEFGHRDQAALGTSHSPELLSSPIAPHPC